MAKRIDDREPVWPPGFEKFNPDDWSSEFEWEYARTKWARAQGFKQYKILPLIQRMAAGATGREDNDNEVET
jgi:hypothetical protein